MQIVQFNNRSSTSPAIVTIGNFDGMHLGHQALIEPVVRQAKAQHCLSALVTFDPHPEEVLKNKQIGKICTPEHRLHLMKQAGLDLVHIIPFTQEFSQLPPESFIEKFLIERFKLAKLVVGYDFRFGKGRAGDCDLLKKMGQSHAFEVEVIQPFHIHQQTVSSTFIRALIYEGKFDDIEPYLGRRYSLYGTVMDGQKRGRTIGFPTANLRPQITLPLPFGVYVVAGEVQNKRLYGVTNIGVRPTFGVNEPTIETYLFDFDQDIYGKPLEIWPLKQLRDEKKFESLDALKKQIQQDIEAAKDYLKTTQPD